MLAFTTITPSSTYLADLLHIQGNRGYTDFLGGGAKRARVGIRLRLYELISITAWSDWGMLIDNKVDGLY